MGAKTERRTGIKSDEIDDFVDKATSVQQAIQGLISGKLNPEDIKIAGLESDSEKAEIERVNKEKQELQQKKTNELKLQRKLEERSRWWAGAEMFVSSRENISEDDADSIVQIRNKYTLDYSKWDQWSPNDPVTISEVAAQQEAEDKIRNKDFESNNAEFCNQFLEDASKRSKAIQVKQESSDICRLKGNNFFQRKEFMTALTFYMDALKLMPYEPKTLLNIAQVYIKLQAIDDAFEFIARTLHVDTSNIKAMSRKAFLLGEKGEAEAALAVISQALLLKPDNEDLIVQHHELQIIARELEIERRVRNCSESTAADTTAAPEPHIMDYHSFVTEFHNILSQMLKTCDHKEVSPDEKNAAYDGAFSNFPWTSIPGSVNKNSFQIAAQMWLVASDKKEFQVFVRTSGLLLTVVQFVKLSTGPFGEQISDDKLAAAVKFLSMMLVNDRAAKLMLHENYSADDIMAVTALLLGEVINMGQLSHRMDSSLEWLGLISVCCTDDACPVLRNCTLRGKLLLDLCSDALDHVNQSLLLSHANKSNTTNSLIEISAKILQLFAFSEVGKTYFTSPENVVKGSRVICTLGCSLHVCAQILQDGDGAERCLEALLGFSQVESVRHCFAAKIPMLATASGSSPSKSSVLAKSMSVVDTISRAISKYADLETNGLAVLMNSCLEGDGSVRSAVAACSALVEILLPVTASASSVTDTGDVIRARRMGLLSRLTAETSMLEKLCQVPVYTRLCQALGRMRHLPADMSQDKHLSDERSHLVRAIAGISKPPANCRAAALQEGLVACLLAVLPTPRDELGEITPASVVLVPNFVPSTLIVGNTARCLMPFADDPDHNVILFDTRSSSIHHGLLGIEKLICAMATCSDIRVRRNIAILLAKGCKLPGVREKITRFRGLQMMVELQDQL